MGAREVQMNVLEQDARKVYFDLRALDGLTPVTTEHGGQPQVSKNGDPWQPGGISPLTHIGHGRYFAILDQAFVGPRGAIIETRYDSINTVESPGDTIRVVGYDPNRVPTSGGGGSGGGGGGGSQPNVSQRVSLQRRRGDTWIIRFTELDASCNPIVTFTIKRRIEDPDHLAILQIRSDYGVVSAYGIVTDPAWGTILQPYEDEIIVRVEAILTQKLDIGDCFIYDLQFNCSGDIETPRDGTFVLFGDVTQAI